MITIFNGRGLVDKRVHAQVDVAMREHLYKFHNGQNLNALGVFLCIALHADEGGWAWPGRDLIKKETGLGEAALKGAFRHLRKMRINNYRIFAHYRTYDAVLHRWGNSAYLILPDSAAEAGPPPAHLVPLVEYMGALDFRKPEVPNDGSPHGGSPHGLLKENHLKEEPVVATATNDCSDPLSLTADTDQPAKELGSEDTLPVKEEDETPPVEEGVNAARIANDSQSQQRDSAAELAKVGVTVPGVVEELSVLPADYIERHAAHRQKHGGQVHWYVTLMRAGEEPHLPGEIAPEPPLPEGMVRVTTVNGYLHLTPAQANERVGYRAYDEGGQLIPAQEAEIGPPAPWED